MSEEQIREEPESEIPEESETQEGKQPAATAKRQPSFREELKKEDEEESVPLWLITFTDAIALMLTFFVLLYAMSSPKVDSWESLTMALNKQFGQHFKKREFSSNVDSIEIERIDKSRALDLNYLNNLLDNKKKESQYMQDMTLNLQKKRLIISLPSELLFGSGDAAITEKGKRSIYVLGDILSRIRNKIEIVGHADPRPMTGSYDSNWHLSLARAASVASVLQSIGYNRNITIRGLSDGLYMELPDSLDAETKQKLSRRVDIVIQRDDGSKKTLFKLDGL